ATSTAPLQAGRNAIQRRNAPKTGVFSSTGGRTRSSRFSASSLRHCESNTFAESTLSASWGREAKRVGRFCSSENCALHAARTATAAPWRWPAASCSPGRSGAVRDPKTAAVLSAAQRNLSCLLRNGPGAIRELGLRGAPGGGEGGRGKRW